VFGSLTFPSHVALAKSVDGSLAHHSFCSPQIWLPFFRDRIVLIFPVTKLILKVTKLGHRFCGLDGEENQFKMSHSLVEGHYSFSWREKHF
jgi:hypothetical protein